MTEKRFRLVNELGDYHIKDGDDELCYDLCSPSMAKKNWNNVVNRLNELHEENEQLKQDRNALIHLLENQSMIIEELHSKLLEYQLKEPIVLTKEDLNLMVKAIYYYTHGRYLE